jgi:Flp pilus assembly protein TadG
MQARVIGAVRAFARDCDGVILPYVAIILAVLVAFCALALDGIRLFTTQTQLQNAADALALAGAAELNRMPDSALRAANAINHLLNNAWGAGESVQVAAITFYASLPASDSAPLPPGTPANACAADITCSTTARFVAVEVKPVSLALFLPGALGGGSGTVSTGASALAGYDQIACNIAPLLICNPFEAPGMTYGQATQALVAADDADANELGHRRLIRLAAVEDGAGTYGPGYFGYLNPATGALPAASCGPSGQSGIAQAMTSAPPLACFRMSGASVATAASDDALDGANTRFDIYANSFAGCLDYPPDQNVRKGYVYSGTPCRSAPVAGNWPLPNVKAAALPPDNAMIATDARRCGAAASSAPCLDVGVALGDGVWDCATYWAQAYGGALSQQAPSGCTTSAAISRYSVYLYEIANGDMSARSVGGESGAPVCSAKTSANARVVTAAIVNCLSAPVPVTPGATKIPVAAFGEFFLTLPANPFTNQSLYVEFVALAKPGAGVVRELVQLYR